MSSPRIRLSHYDLTQILDGLALVKQYLNNYDITQIDDEDFEWVEEENKKLDNLVVRFKKRLAYEDQRERVLPVLPG